MSTASVRTILPLSIVTCTSMLAMDFYLPAVPNLQASFGVDVTLAQATIAVFLAGLAASQLLWAEALTRLGPKEAVRFGLGLLIATSIGSALAPTIEVLLFMRLLQGIGAGAAMVVAPSVVRATLSDENAVRGIATISIIESLVPAAGPVFGAALLVYTDWRGIFWILAVLALIAFPFVLRVLPRELPGMDRSVDSAFTAILSNARFRRLTASHALALGALLTFVASAPQLLIHTLSRGASSFALLQVCSVTAFVIAATQSARISKRIGSANAVQYGAWVQTALCTGMLLISYFDAVSFPALLIFWCAFCASLAIRGPAAFSEALAVPPAQMGRASAMMVLAILFAGAVGTQLVAPFMNGASATPLLFTMLVACALSVALVIPYPQGFRKPADT